MSVSCVHRRVVEGIGEVIGGCVVHVDVHGGIHIPNKHNRLYLLSKLKHALLHTVSYLFLVLIPLEATSEPQLIHQPQRRGAETHQPMCGDYNESNSSGSILIGVE